MTTDSLEQLRNLTNINALRENQLKADSRRPDSRPVLEDFEADIKVLGQFRNSGNRQDGTEWATDVIRLGCSNVVNYKSRAPWAEGYIEIDIPLSDKENSQLGFTTNSLIALMPEAQTIVDLDGKRARLTDTVGDLGWDRKFTRRDGTEGSERATLWYYKVVSISGGAKANGSKPVASVSTQAQDAALAYCVGKPLADLTSGPGIQEFIKYLNSQSLLEVPLQTEIVGRKFVARMIEEGKLADSEAGLVLV